jgi:CheY-like chemotaxis protein
VRLLVIEDQASIRVAAASLLRAHGHDVREAATVAAALAALDDSTPEAVILDLALDAPSAALHERLRECGAPVLVVSGVEEERARQVSEAFGWQLLPKPFEPDDLVSRVASLLPSRRPSRPHVLPPPPPAPAATTPVAPPTERPPLEALPSLSLSGAPDPWRDRIRVVADRVIYAGALVAVVLLALRGKLDVATTGAILLVAGVRPHNLFEAATAARNGNGGGSPRAGVALLLAPALESLRHGTWLAR